MQAKGLDVKRCPVSDRQARAVVAEYRAINGRWPSVRAGGTPAALLRSGWPGRFAAWLAAALLLLMAAASAASAAPAPVTPRNNTAAIFTTFGPTQNPRTGRPNAYGQGLKTLERYLSSEHYHVVVYEGKQATLPNFVKLARAGIAVFFTHGGDHGNLLVQREPTPGALLHAYSKYLAAGYSPADIEGHSFREGVGKAKRDVHGLWLTPHGIRHFFSASHVPLVAGLACDSLQDAKYFQARSYFGYTTCVQVISALSDSINVLGRMTGIAGVDKRTSSAAFADIKATDGFAIASPDRPVVLSPAVVSVSPQAGDQVTAGKPTPASVTFDAQMARSLSGGVVTAQGCGATVTHATWGGGGTKLSFDLNVPRNPSGSTITLTVHHDKAVADPGRYPNDWLDGNQSPSPHSGEAPNGTDYQWDVSCRAGAVYKTVFSGSYSFNYTSAPLNGATSYQENASFTWTLTELDTYTASQPQPGGSVRYREVADFSYVADGSSAYGQADQLNTCTETAGSGDKWEQTLIDGALTPPAAVVHSPTTSLAFGWFLGSNAGLPSTQNGTVCKGPDGPSVQKGVVFPVPQRSDANDFLLGQSGEDSAFSYALGNTASATVQYQQLPYTLPLNVEVPQHSNQGGQSGELHFHGTVTFSRVQ